MTLSELRRERKSFRSDCCTEGFESKSNGLWTYYVCKKCGKQTIPKNDKGKMLDLHGLIKRYTGNHKIQKTIKK